MNIRSMEDEKDSYALFGNRQTVQVNFVDLLMSQGIIGRQGGSARRLSNFIDGYVDRVQLTVIVAARDQACPFLCHTT